MILLKSCVNICNKAINNWSSYAESLIKVSPDKSTADALYMYIFSDITGNSGSPPAVSTDGLNSSESSSGVHRNIYHSTPEEEVRPVLHRIPHYGMYLLGFICSHRCGYTTPKIINIKCLSIFSCFNIIVGVS